MFLRLVGCDILPQMDCTGFNSVELVMGVEDIFDLHIPDKEAEQIRTLCDLELYILQRVSVRTDIPSRCVSAESFYVMRRRFLNRFVYPRRLLRPTTALADILPANPESRMRRWSELQQAVGVRLPDLTFSPSFIASVGMLVIFLLAMAAYVGHLQVVPAQRAGLYLVASTLVVAAIASPFTLMGLFWRSKSTVPGNCTTLGDVAMYLLCQELGPAKLTWTRDEIWQTIRWLTAKCAGLPPRELTRGTTISELNAI